MTRDLPGRAGEGKRGRSRAAAPRCRDHDGGTEARGPLDARRGDHRGGFVLVAVLTVAVLLAGLMGAVMLMVRAGVDTARTQAGDLTADALVRSGLELAGYQLFMLKLPASGLDSQQVRLDGGTVTLFVTGESGKIDLNGSGPELLAAAYKAAKLEALSPEVFAGRVIDWRDNDEEVTDNGAEAGDYAAADVSWRPQNDVFRSVDDLQYVLGVAPKEIAALRPYLTVFNPTGTVNLYDAPRPVLAAIPGLSEPNVERILRLRRTRGEKTDQQLANVVGEAQSYVATDAGLAFAVRLEARPNAGAEKTVRAVLIPDISGKAAYRIVDWQE